MRKDTMTKNNENQNCRYMTRRIGSTTYKVKVVFSDNGSETLEEKILRMIRNEGGFFRSRLCICQMKYVYYKDIRYSVQI